MSEPIRWNELTPRERDALVRERMFGTKQVRAKGTDKYVTVRSDCNLVDGAWTVDELERHGGPLPYSTDIAAAWEVVGKLEERGFYCLEIIRGYVVPSNGADWACEIKFSMTRPTDDLHPDLAKLPDINEHAPTAPEAICLAALRAVGLEGRDAD